MRDTLSDGRPLRPLNVSAEGKREARRLEVGTSIPAARVVRGMDPLIEVYGRPEAIRLDNGPELTAEVFVHGAKDHGVKLRLIPPGKPNQNAFIERFNRSVREEVLNAYLFNPMSEVQHLAEEGVTDSNTSRPPAALGAVPPTAFLPRLVKQASSTLELST